MSVKAIAEGLIALGEKMKYLFEAGKKAERERFWKDFFNKQHYFALFAGVGWDEKTFNPIWPSEPIRVQGLTGATGTFFYFNRTGANQIDLTEACKHIDFSQARKLEKTFESANAKNITCDFSSAEMLKETFTCGNGGSMDNISIKVTEKCTSFTQAFYNLNMATTIRFIEGSVIAAAISFAESRLLSTESVDSIIRALQDRTGLTALKVTFHTTVVANLTEEQITLIGAKNWRVG